jgi:hypothetical protein
LGFSRFSLSIPELLFVFVNLDPKHPSLVAPLCEVKKVSDALGDAAHIRFMRLNPPDYVMTADGAVSLEGLVAKGT